MRHRYKDKLGVVHYQARGPNYQGSYTECELYNEKGIYMDIKNYVLPYFPVVTCLVCLCCVKHDV